jgi:triacylglycerol lipase
VNVPTTTVVLAHGILRFDQLNVLLSRQIGPRYFDGIGDYLRRNGFTVDEPAVNFTGSLAKRAADLKARLDAIPADKIHIIGHSMGGLDARKVIAEHPDVAQRVACLTTVGTPHLGTSSANLAFRLGGETIINALAPVIDLAGFRDLTTDACERFNAAVADREAANGVRYRTVYAAETVLRTSPLLLVTAKQLAAEDASDGIVPLKSQQWTREIVAAGGARKKVEQIEFPFPADHLNEVGLWDTGELLGGLDPLTLQRYVQHFYLHLAATA